MCAWRRMLRSVPTGISVLRGAIAVSTTSPARRTNFTWLPFWLASTNPAASSRRLTSRNGSGLSRPNLDLNAANFRRASGNRRFEVQLQRLLQIVQRLGFSFALRRNVNLKTLGDVPGAFLPYRGRKYTFHPDSFSADNCEWLASVSPQPLPATAAASRFPARPWLLPAGSPPPPPPYPRLRGSAASRPASSAQRREPYSCRCG